jgi:hypothetical protein
MDLLVDLVGRFGVTAVIATHEQGRVAALRLRELSARPRDPGGGYGSLFVDDND